MLYKGLLTSIYTAYVWKDNKLIHTEGTRTKRGTPWKWRDLAGYNDPYKHMTSYVCCLSRAASTVAVYQAPKTLLQLDSSASDCVALVKRCSEPAPHTWMFKAHISL